MGGVNIMHSKRYIVHRQPVSSPGDYYGALMNTIDDIISIFKTREAAELYCGGTNILKHAWVDANTLEFAQEDWANNEYWCEDCNEIVDIAEEEETNESNKDIC